MQSISCKEFASKFRSKNECYKFPRDDAKVHVPPRDTVTIYHLKDMIGMKKKVSASLLGSSNSSARMKFS